MRKLSFAAAAFVVGVLALAASARADCISQCGNTYGYGTYNDTTCLNLCQKKTQTQYGAIAFGQGNGAEGISWGKATQAQANSAALAACAPHGDNCQIVYRFWNTCAALGVAKGAMNYSTATASSQRQAETLALRSCQRNWGTCLVDLSACSR